MHRFRHPADPHLGLPSPPAVFLAIPAGSCRGVDFLRVFDVLGFAPPHEDRPPICVFAPVHAWCTHGVPIKNIIYICGGFLAPDCCTERHLSGLVLSVFLQCTVFRIRIAVYSRAVLVSWLEGVWLHCSRSVFVLHCPRAVFCYIAQGPFCLTMLSGRFVLHCSRAVFCYIAQGCCLTLLKAV